MPNVNPVMEAAINKARHGHKDWLVWQDRNGDTQAARAGADAYKAAMLACGTQRWFTLVTATHAHFYRMTWSLAVRHWRNARRGFC